METSFVILFTYEKAIKWLKIKLEAVEKELTLNVEHCLK